MKFGKKPSELARKPTTKGKIKGEEKSVLEIDGVTRRGNSKALSKKTRVRKIARKRERASAEGHRVGKRGKSKKEIF